MAESTFKELEQTGWRQKASAARPKRWFATVTRQAIEPTLDALGDNFSGTPGFSIFALGQVTWQAPQQSAERWQRDWTLLMQWSLKRGLTIPN